VCAAKPKAPRAKTAKQIEREVQSAMYHAAAAADGHVKVYLNVAALDHYARMTLIVFLSAHLN
jgi:hypothetical protein